jgi:ribosome-associated protein
MTGVNRAGDARDGAGFGARGGAEDAPEVPEVPIRDASIRLGQFLKLADLVDTGADVKPLLADGDVQVNGEVETRRGRQLVAGDVVRLDAPAGVRIVRVGRGG